ncbi:hypothetical protein DL96DRAFT_1017485 [Flagelloscypha sp. PMI_526]|nr:hypothetical protein DL96DRAFT_1017485 [Flagelloscypha sp. PMI_526]
MVFAPSMTPNQAHIIGYNVLQILGFFATSCVTLTAYFSPRIHRSSNWYMAMFMWMWWCISYSLLMLGWHQFDVGTVPPRALCTIQAAFIYASPSSAGFANFSILAQISSILIEGVIRETRPIKLLYVPLICYITIFFISLSVGIDNLPQVIGVPLHAYCNINNIIPSAVSAIACFIAAVLILLLEVFTFALLWKHRAWLKRMKKSSRPPPIGLFIRVVCFSTGPIIASILSAASIRSNALYENPAVVLLTAGAPLFAALTFGTQQDIINAWKFWKRPVPLTQ